MARGLAILGHVAVISLDSLENMPQYYEITGDSVGEPHRLRHQQ